MLILSSGVANAVIFWYDLVLFKDISLNNGPRGLGSDSCRTGGNSALQSLVKDLFVKEGDLLDVTASHNETKITFELEGDANLSEGVLASGLNDTGIGIPKKLDKFIPRWLVNMTSDEDHYCRYHAAFKIILDNFALMVLRVLLHHYHISRGNRAQKSSKRGCALLPC